MFSYINKPCNILFTDAMNVFVVSGVIVVVTDNFVGWVQSDVAYMYIPQTVRVMIDKNTRMFCRKLWQMNSPTKNGTIVSNLL